MRSRAASILSQKSHDAGANVAFSRKTSEPDIFANQVAEEPLGIESSKGESTSHGILLGDIYSKFEMVL